MSAASNLAGFFWPTGDQVWNNQISWQPVPIHTVPVSADYTVNAEVPCARFDDALTRYKSTPEYQAMLEKHKSLFKYLEQNTGTPIRSLDNVQDLNNTLWIESVTNKT